MAVLLISWKIISEQSCKILVFCFGWSAYNIRFVLWGLLPHCVHILPSWIYFSFGLWGLLFRSQYVRIHGCCSQHCCHGNLTTHSLTLAWNKTYIIHKALEGYFFVKIISCIFCYTRGKCGLIIIFLHFGEEGVFPAGQIIDASCRLNFNDIFLSLPTPNLTHHRQLYS